MADPIERRVLAELDRLGVTYQQLACDPEMADTAAFCAHYGYDLAESANAILIASKRPPGQFSLCLVLAHTRLDVNKRVRDLMAVRKLSFASAEATKDATGMLIGGVTPFGMPDPIPIYVDSRIMELDRIIIGGGSRSSKLSISPEAFEKLPNAQVVVDLAVAAD